MFWFGGIEPSRESVDAAYRALGREAAAVFPLRFEAETGHTSGNASGVVRGFYWLKDFRDLAVRT
jgi:hypothetical protein